jgi:hypothetical protein
MKDLEKRRAKIEKDCNALESKTDFVISLAPKIDRSPKYLMKHYFSKSQLRTEIPLDLKMIEIIEAELKISKKKSK